MRRTFRTWGVFVIVSVLNAAAETPSGNLLPQISSLQAPTFSDDSQVYWRKPKNLTKMREERAILVTVRTQKAPESGFKQLHVTGAGFVKAPLTASFTKLTEFSQWQKISSHISKSQYHPSSQVLELEIVAFGFKANLPMRVFLFPDERQPQVRFLVIAGGFKGLSGQLKLEELGRFTPVSMRVFYQYETLPLPAFFIEFGLEVIFQRIAEKLRIYLEEYKLSS